MFLLRIYSDSRTSRNARFHESIVSAAIGLSLKVTVILPLHPSKFSLKNTNLVHVESRQSKTIL